MFFFLLQNHWLLLLAILVSLLCQIFILVSNLTKIEAGDDFFYDNKEVAIPSPSLQRTDEFEQKFYQETDTIKESMQDDLQNIKKGNFFLKPNEE